MFRMFSFVRITIFTMLVATGAHAGDVEPRTAAGTDADQPSSAAFPAIYDNLAVGLGDPDAPVVLREFGDYQCPACRRFHEDSFGRLKSQYIDTGKLRFLFYDFPLSGRHDHAKVAAMAARCAGHQDGYWPMHRLLYSHQKDWSSAQNPLNEFRTLARSAGLDPEQLAQCVQSGQTGDAVASSADVARKLGVPSTPFLILDSLAIRGAVPFEQLEKLIEKRLADQDNN